MIRSFLVYYFKPTLKNWRALRRLCMAKLPAKDRADEPAAAA